MEAQSTLPAAPSTGASWAGVGAAATESSSMTDFLQIGQTPFLVNNQLIAQSRWNKWLQGSSITIDSLTMNESKQIEQSVSEGYRGFGPRRGRDDEKEGETREEERRRRRRRGRKERSRVMRECGVIDVDAVEVEVVDPPRNREVDSSTVSSPASCWGCKVKPISLSSSPAAGSLVDEEAPCPVADPAVAPDFSGLGSPHLKTTNLATALFGALSAFCARAIRTRWVKTVRRVRREGRNRRRKSRSSRGLFSAYSSLVSFARHESAKQDSPSKHLVFTQNDF